MKQWAILAGLLGLLVGSAKAQVFCEVCREPGYAKPASQFLSGSGVDTRLASQLAYFFGRAVDQPDMPKLRYVIDPTIDILETKVTFNIESKCYLEALSIMLGAAGLTYIQDGCRFIILRKDGGNLKRIATVPFAAEVLQYYVGTAELSPELFKTADFNRDNKVDIADAQLILWVAVHL